MNVLAMEPSSFLPEVLSRWSRSGASRIHFATVLVAVWLTGCLAKPAHPQLTIQPGNPGQGLAYEWNRDEMADVATDV
jgi:hypothetical protein